MAAFRAMTQCAAFSLALVTSASAGAQTIDCKQIAPAMIKQTTTPYHAYTTTTGGYTGGKPRESEVVSTGTAMYVMNHGKWMRSPISPQKMAEMQRELVDSVSRSYKCARVGSETVNGAPTQRFHIEGKSEVGELKEDLWVDASGRVQRLEMDQDLGGGATGHSHSSMRYDYTNVKAPPGVQ